MKNSLRRVIVLVDGREQIPIPEKIEEHFANAGIELLAESSSHIENICSRAGLNISALTSPTARVASLRNLTLILIVALSTRQALLLDDDIVDFDSALRSVSDLLLTHADSKEIIAGTNIEGADSRDRLTRMSTYLRRIRPDDGAQPDLRLAHPDECRALEGTCRSEYQEVDHISGGFSLLRIAPENLLPFPLCYNEFWIWCHLQRRVRQTTILRGETTVTHLQDSAERIPLGRLAFEAEGIYFYKVLRSLPAFKSLDNLPDCLDHFCGTIAIDPSKRVRDIEQFISQYSDEEREQAAIEVGLDASTLVLPALQHSLSTPEPRNRLLALAERYLESSRALSHLIHRLHTSHSLRCQLLRGLALQRDTTLVL